MIENVAAPKKVTVYYDGICNLCSKEISYYKRIAPPASFNWIDIARDEKALNAQGISQADALRYLHASEPNGKLVVGVDAFLLIWKQLPKWKVLARIMQVPPLKGIAKIAYKAFADRRFKRLSHCQMAQNKVDQT